MVRKRKIIASLLVLVAILAVTTTVCFLATRDNGGSDAAVGEATESTEEEAAVENPGNSEGSGNSGISMEEFERAVGAGPGPGADNPPLPSGQPATHLGTALMTTIVSGQSFVIEVAVTIELDGAGGFVFAYAGTGTVPVNLGAGIAATADYKVGGNFSGSVTDGAFSGSGPAAIQATVNIGGMAPQSGSSSEQLTIKGAMRETSDGVVEGTFAGGAYSGTFKAKKS